jgi:hypothetical protein
MSEEKEKGGKGKGKEGEDKMRQNKSSVAFQACTRLE